MMNQRKYTAPNDYRAFCEMLKETKTSMTHHGIKGQKWGVRRFQNADGTLTTLGKKRYLITNGSREDSNKIYKTLSKKEKNYIQGNNSYDKPQKELISKDDSKYILKQVLMKYGDTPIAAVDLWNENKKSISISIMTRNDEKYRGKGYASKVLEKALNDVISSKEFNKYKYINWGVWKENEASRKMARKHGFKYVKTSDPGGEEYILYRKKIN